jgi:hypothetical protein
MTATLYDLGLGEVFYDSRKDSSHMYIPAGTRTKYICEYYYYDHTQDMFTNHECVPVLVIIPFPDIFVRIVQIRTVG